MKKKATKKKQVQSRKTVAYFVLELAFSIFVAWMLSLIVWSIMAFVIANVTSYDNSTDNYVEVFMPAVIVGNIVFGLVIGYRLKTLLDQYHTK